jgi:hypothetical protein
VQFVVWVAGSYPWLASTFCGGDAPFMSASVTALVRFTGAALFPEADHARQMMMGMELLHLVGNGIFVATIAGAL